MKNDRLWCPVRWRRRTSVKWSRLSSYSFNRSLHSITLLCVCYVMLVMVVVVEGCSSADGDGDEENGKAIRWRPF